MLTEKGKCMSLTKSRKTIDYLMLPIKTEPRPKKQCCTVWDFSQWRSPACHNRPSSSPLLWHEITCTVWDFSQWRSPACHNRPSSAPLLSHEITCIVQLFQAVPVVVWGLLPKAWGQFRSAPAQRHIQLFPVNCVHVEPPTLLTTIQLSLIHIWRCRRWP